MTMIIQVAGAGNKLVVFGWDIQPEFCKAVKKYASRAVQFHPHGGKSDFVWLSARTPHGAYVW